MKNISLKKLFCSNLHELMEESLTLFQSLKILSESKLSQKKIREASAYLAGEMEKGRAFSEALKTCRSISFDRVFISFASFSEQSGRLNEVLDYMKREYERKEELYSLFVNALAYPVFVVIVLISLLAVFLSSDMFSQSGSLIFSDKEDLLKKTGECGFLFFAMVTSFVFFIWKFLNENTLCEAFRACGFLVKNGTDISLAVGMAAWICGHETNNGKMFLKAREGLEYGMDLKSAFMRSGKRNTERKIETFLFIAEETGDRDEVFGKIAGALNKENEKKRKFCMGLVEPVFIAITGFFLLSLTVNIILPVMTEFGI